MRINRRSLSRALTLVLVAGAVAAPVASARPIVNPPQPVSAVQIETVPAQTSAVKSTGFDWGDAGIGAGAIVVLVLAGVAALSIAHRRQPHAAGARTTISAS
jgi:hypothetical protein